MKEITNLSVQFVNPPINKLPASFAITDVKAGDTMNPMVTKVQLFGTTDTGAQFMVEFDIRNEDLIWLCRLDMVEIINRAFADGIAQGAFNEPALS